MAAGSILIYLRNTLEATDPHAVQTYCGALETCALAQWCTSDSRMDCALETNALNRVFK